MSCPGCFASAAEMERKYAVLSKEVKEKAIAEQRSYAIWQEAGEWHTAPVDTIEGHRPELRYISKYNG
jgi:hypothetical protein